MSTHHASLPQAAAHTSTGRLRSSNEDAFGLSAERGIFVVCDGMGGAAGGEIASRLAVDAVMDHLLAHAREISPREGLHRAIAAANRTVLDRADSDPGLNGMGTTLVALLLLPGIALIAHAGDSRCYLFRGGHLLRQTHDHSLVDEQMRLGTITAEEAERSPFRSVITRAIGTQPSVAEEIHELPVEPGDLFLLCTDGLTREVDEDSMARILRAGASLDRTAQDLLDAANENGGRDNITCLLVRVP